MSLTFTIIPGWMNEEVDGGEVWQDARFPRREVCLPRIPWENPVPGGSMPMEVLALAWTRGLAGSQSSRELG